MQSLPLYFHHLRHENMVSLLQCSHTLTGRVPTSNVQQTALVLYKYPWLFARHLHMYNLIHFK